jgi:hypothetical protein
MAINELHASHIRRVEVGFVISGPELDPETVTKTLGLQPDLTAKRGDTKPNSLSRETEGFWRLDTRNKVPSKDINDHIHYLLALLLPRRDEILELAQEGETFLDVLWQSTYLYAGTGPVIASDCLQGIAQLQAGIGFDIYQVDED